MKAALLLTLVSLPAFAVPTCFTRDAELNTNRVSLAREYCVSDIRVVLSGARDGRAELTLIRDGVQQRREFILLPASGGAPGTTAFSLRLDQDYKGGACDYTWEAAVYGRLLVKAGSPNEIESLHGEVTFTTDNCHGGNYTEQNITFTKR